MKKRKKTERDSVWREEVGRQRGGEGDVGLSHPVPCCGDMSFSSIHGEKERDGAMEREREDRNTAPRLRNLRPQPRPETFSTGKKWKERHVSPAFSDFFFTYIVL